jgi:hypothetical protein
MLVSINRACTLSPILFTVYLDVILIRHEELNVGCHMGHLFAGSLLMLMLSVFYRLVGIREKLLLFSLLPVNLMLNLISINCFDFFLVMMLAVIAMSL